MAASVRSALDELLSQRVIVQRPRAKQWRFLRATVDRLLDVATVCEFESLSPTAAAQLKYEVEDRLRRYYLRAGRPLQWVFSLVHVRDVVRNALVSNPEQYPALAGYCLLIRRHDPSLVPDATPSRVELKAYLEKVVVSANDAEFRAYLALPRIQDEELKSWFVPGGPAHREIVNLLRRHRERGWVLTNPYNPSTKRILRISVSELKLQEAVVRTTEYWYLRWWDSNTGSYTYPYRETNRQMYILRRDGDNWRVYENLRPSPRTSAPHRRFRR